MSKYLQIAHTFKMKSSRKDTRARKSGIGLHPRRPGPMSQPARCFPNEHGHQKHARIQVLTERWVPACAGMARGFIARSPRYLSTSIELHPRRRESGDPGLYRLLLDPRFRGGDGRRIAGPAEAG